MDHWTAALAPPTSGKKGEDEGMGKLETPRQTAERITESFRAALGFNLNRLIDLGDAIEAALKNRDIRAVSIAQSHGPCQDGCYCGSDIAVKIRDDDTGSI